MGIPKSGIKEPMLTAGLLYDKKVDELTDKKYNQSKPETTIQYVNRHAKSCRKIFCSV